MQHVERFEFRIDRLRALDMEDRGNRAGLQAVPNVLDVAADADAAFGLAFDPHEDRRHAEHGGLGFTQFERRRQRRADAGVEAWAIAVVALARFAVG